MAVEGGARSRASTAGRVGRFIFASINLSHKEESHMRLGRVICACAVATSSLALLAPGASAFKHPSSDGRCAVNIAVVPKEITSGESVTIFGRLLCRGQKRTANQVVKLFDHIPGTPGFTYVQSAVTSAQGYYEFQHPGGAIETSRTWHVRAQGAESGNVAVKVAAQVTLSGPPEGTQILTGPANAVTFTGTVAPADIGARVILQRQDAATGGEWHAIQIVRLHGGSFSITHTFRYPGDANIRVLVRSQRRNVPSTSNTLEYEVSQAQNPNLTIVASANPISYGQAVTISGILAKGAHQLVTLLARTALQPDFTPVAQATTDAAGNYVFPAQSPINSTFYEVQSGPMAASGSPSTVPAVGTGAAPPPAGGEASAVLAIGVRDLLTAQVSATSVQAGQSLTFSGSVAPSHAGDLIYLERQNPSGAGFHVAEVAVISPNSTFSITHQVFGTGTEVFRVLIPGGPENFGAASQLFTVNVTPAPAASLKPEVPGNTTQPSEGSTSPSNEKAQ
jgi:hypothetical protein